MHFHAVSTTEVDETRTMYINTSTHLCSWGALVFFFLAVCLGRAPEITFRQDDMVVDCGIAILSQEHAGLNCRKHEK